MILTCPECGTQYAVKDGAIPEGGRQVRCASCKHSWHQDPEPLELGPEAEADAIDQSAVPETGPEPEPEPEPELESETQPEPDAEADDHRPGPPGYAPVDPVASDSDEYPEAAADTAFAGDPDVVDEEPGAGEWQPRGRDDDFSPFAHGRVGDEQGRSPLRGLLIALLVLAVLGAAFWFLAPAEWKARVGLAQAAETPLQLMMTHSDRQRLESGNELLAVSGRVINPTDQRQTVPPIQAQLRSRAGELVHSWTIAPPTPSLGPGESRPFNSAEVNVPAGGDELTISLGSPRA